MSEVITSAPGMLDVVVLYRGRLAILYTRRRASSIALCWIYYVDFPIKLMEVPVKDVRIKMISDMSGAFFQAP